MPLTYEDLYARAVAAFAKACGEPLELARLTITAALIDAYGEGQLEALEVARAAITLPDKPPRESRG